MTAINAKEQKIQPFDRLFVAIGKADKDSDGKIGNVFQNATLNKDYQNVLTSKNPNERKSFIEKLLTADYFGGENADKKTDAKIDGNSIFALQEGKQKEDILKIYSDILNETGLNRPQEANQVQNNNISCPAFNELDPFGIGEIRELVSESFKPRNYSSAKIKELNSNGIYTSATEMTPDMIKNITNGKVKDIQAGTYGGVKLNQDQVNNAKVIAATIVDIGKQKNKSPEELHKAVVIALATAMQESTLKNIGYGDINQKTGKMTSSRGLFQQIKAWGSEEDRMNPVQATAMFAEKLYQTDYMNKSVTCAAQNVQKSAFPDAYAKWQNMAEALAGAMLSD